MNILVKGLLVFLIFFAAGCALPFAEKMISKYMERRRKQKCSEK